MERSGANRRSRASAGSFERLFRDHYTNVRNFVARRVRTPEVDDVVSETFATAWRRWSELPPDVGFHRAWLLRVASYTILNQRRSTRRHLALVGKVADDARSGRRMVVGDPYVAISSVPSDRIDAVFSALSPGDQLVLTLVAWDDLTVPELAVVLDCSENAATTRLCRARARFRSMEVETRD